VYLCHASRGQKKLRRAYTSRGQRNVQHAAIQCFIACLYLSNAGLAAAIDAVSRTSADISS
jgi:hypothetical protein